MKQVQQSYDTTYVRANPRVGGTFDIVPGLALYAAFATGFRGAVNFIGENTPRPETSRNEASANNFADHRTLDPYSYLAPVVIPNQPRSAYLSLKTTFGRK